jgi:hypothetical protein
MNKLLPFLSCIKKVGSVKWERGEAMFNPHDYIEPLGDNLMLCSNPVADGGLSAITVNIALNEDHRRAFKESIKRMVLNKLFSPKFAEVIFSAFEMHPHMVRRA